MPRLKICCGVGRKNFFALVATILVAAGLIYVAASPIMIISALHDYSTWLKMSKISSIVLTGTCRMPETERPHEEATSNEVPANSDEDEDIVVTSVRKNVLKAMNQRLAEGIKTPTILVWRSQKHMERVSEKELEFLLGRQCGGCQVTMDRSTLNESVAVVMFNHPELRKDMDIPDQRTRRPEQHYVFWTRESPSKTYRYHEAIEDKRFDTLFNLTMYFRRDADIVQGFGNAESALRRSKEREEKGDLKLSSKTKLAVWIVSNCYPLYGAVERMRYARKLVDAGLDFDRFGKCFETRESPVSSNVTKYKFYFSFENSIHCPDYITEKFWRNGLRVGLVPVVLGPLKSDVAAVAPNHSFIHVEDFNSPKDLVDYLRYLDTNDTAYMEYHQWRKGAVNETIPKEDISNNHHGGFCRLCKRIVLENHPPKVIPSVSEWLYRTRYVDDLCLKPKYKLSEEELHELINF